MATIIKRSMTTWHISGMEHKHTLDATVWITARQPRKVYLKKLQYFRYVTVRNVCNITVVSPIFTHTTNFYFELRPPRRCLQGPILNLCHRRSFPADSNSMADKDRPHSAF